MLKIFFGDKIQYITRKINTIKWHYMSMKGTLANGPDISVSGGQIPYGASSMN